MKVIAWLLAILVIVSSLLLGLERVAAERVEVVELQTRNSQGKSVTTRLWIVDDEGFQYLRVGSGGSGWFDRLTNNQTFQLDRKGDTATYTAKLRPDKSTRINALMLEKYTWGDNLIAMMVGSRDGSIPVELHPLN